MMTLRFILKEVFILGLVVAAALAAGSKATDNSDESDSSERQFVGLPSSTTVRTSERLGLFSFWDELDTLRWVAYSPTRYEPGVQWADPDTMRADLDTLSKCGFSGVATYGTMFWLDRIPQIAQEIGLEGVIMGVWISTDTTANRQEIEKAIAQKVYVDGYCVGNEVLLRGDQNTTYLDSLMQLVRDSTSLPVTTSEHVNLYVGGPFSDWLLQKGDWVFPIINPTDNDITNSSSARDWVQGQFETLAALAQGKPVLIKECGWPTSSLNSSDTIWADEDTQWVYFSSLDTLRDTTDFRFCHFEAFDQYWKTWAPTQPFWGLYDTIRTPKKYMREAGCVRVGIAEKRSMRELPKDFLLSQNQPNPFYRSTMITYSLPTANHVTLGVYDIAGRLVAILVDERQQPGAYEVCWGAENRASGIYFYRLRARDFTDSKKMIVLR